MNHLIPRHKDDQKAIKNLQAARPAQVLAVAKELLEWVEDGNWPVSYPIGKVLSQYVNQLQDELLPILRGHDAIWKMWCIRFILEDVPVAQLDHLYLLEVERIATYPTSNEVAEGAAEVAQEALVYWRT
jgi:hypothetical protein